LTAVGSRLFFGQRSTTFSRSIRNDKDSVNLNSGFCDDSGRYDFHHRKRLPMP